MNAPAPVYSAPELSPNRLDFLALRYVIQKAPTDLDASRPYGLVYGLLTGRGLLVRDSRSSDPNGAPKTYKALGRALRARDRFLRDEPRKKRGLRVVVLTPREDTSAAEAAEARWLKALGT